MDLVEIRKKAKNTRKKPSKKPAAKVKAEIPELDNSSYRFLPPIHNWVRFVIFCLNAFYRDISIYYLSDDRHASCEDQVFMVPSMKIQILFN